ncbi:MAG: PSD1 and planctomycete cytochrome C domain-containing protein [Isosphaeraceae bacterium]
MAARRRVALVGILVVAVTAWSNRGEADDAGAGVARDQGKGGSSTAANSKAAAAPKAKPIGFARDVRPILSDHCFACHGPDDKARKAGLRLDTQEGAFGELESGAHAIVPGKPGDSELIARVESHDPEELMPPRKFGKPLSSEQVAVLRQWVEQGATWTKHWAFKAPVKAVPPSVKDKNWPINEVDRFILDRLDDAGLRPEPEATRTALIRRVTLDLTGLPPTPEEVDAFLADRSARAYETVVDRLLDSPRYGEHMARFWLDAARYGDTHGLHLDNYREIWPYRDWVIRAFNANKPFDRFIVEQLAGDLLPNPTLDQLVATGFNRCHISTSEGGSIEEEVYVRNIVDQVDTNGTVFLGLSTGCARCHDHKYDPIRAKDYYQLFAFFNNIDGPALDGNSATWAPIARVPTAGQREAMAKADAEIASARKAVTDEVDRASAACAARAKVAAKDDASKLPARGEFVWVDDDLPPGASPQGDGQFVEKKGHPVHAGNRSLLVNSGGLVQRFFDNADERLVVGKGDTFFAHVYLDPKKAPAEIMLQWHTSAGWSHRAYWGANAIDWGKDGTPERLAMGKLPERGRWVRLEVPVDRLKLAPGTVINGMAFTQQGGTVHWDAAGIISERTQDGQRFESFGAWVRAQRERGPSAGLPDELKAAVKLEPAKWSEAQATALAAYFVARADATTARSIAALQAKLTAAEARKKEIEAKAPTTLVFRERSGEPKPAYFLKRGEYDQRGEKVGRAVPAFLPPLPPGEPVNRLGLARWLVSPNHPLTARVAVNRLWQQVFGTGIVKTAEDFGSQGEPPSHPELLDWLAVQFREDGWDVKRMMKRLVMSATYRQSSRVSPEKLAKDPDNRLLARGPRYRLDAETLRDQALYVSGLLVEHLGGPSVKPWQPSGLWEAVGYTSSNTAKFVADKGAEKVHRRSLYIFWKRTSAPPQMTTFDAPSREACTVRRERTNTPLQALLLLNEPQMIESSRALAQRVLRAPGCGDCCDDCKDPAGGGKAAADTAVLDRDRITRMFRLAVGRGPDARELAELTSALGDFRAHYRGRLDDARKLINTGESRPDPGLAPDELAAWTMIANVVLNLDEVITKG